MGTCQVCGVQKVSKWRWVHPGVQGRGLSRRCPRGGQQQRAGLGLSAPVSEESRVGPGVQPLVRRSRVQRVSGGGGGDGDGAQSAGEGSAGRREEGGASSADSCVALRSSVSDRHARSGVDVTLRP